jgi:hypothetical protein
VQTLNYCDAAGEFFIVSKDPEDRDSSMFPSEKSHAVSENSAPVDNSLQIWTTSIAWVSPFPNGTPGRKEKKTRMRMHAATGFVSHGKQLTDGLLQRLIMNGERPMAGNAIGKQVSPLAGMWAANPDDRPSSAAIVVCM